MMEMMIQLTQVAGPPGDLKVIISVQKILLSRNPNGCRKLAWKTSQKATKARKDVELSSVGANSPQ